MIAYLKSINYTLYVKDRTSYILPYQNYLQVYMSGTLLGTMDTAMLKL
jgi:hypothetical protein